MRRVHDNERPPRFPRDQFRDDSLTLTANGQQPAVMPDVRYCFILNPAAGGGFAERSWPGLQRELRAAGIEHRVCVSKYRGHGRELARAAFEAGERNFLVVGGDGTANEVLNGLIGPSGPDAAGFSLGAVPWGTGNDWARQHAFPRRAGDLIEALRTASFKQQDIGRATFTDSAAGAGPHYFLNCAGTGFDSYLLTQMASIPGRRFRYFLALMKCLRTFRASDLTLDLETESLEATALLLEICIGRYAGAGMLFAPDALADDGLLDLLLIEDLNMLQVLRSLPYLYNGRINEHPATRAWRCRRLSIMSSARQYLHCDGEVVGELPVEIDIQPGRLRVLRSAADCPPD
jgi:YegS/Rv2252/BmrU family lipid kinase